MDHGNDEARRFRCLGANVGDSVSRLPKGAHEVSN